MCTSRRRRNSPWEMHLIVIARSRKSGIFPLLLPDEGKFQESNFCAKSFGRRERFFICPNLVFSSSIDSSWCVHHEEGGIHREKCIWWWSRGPKSQAFSSHLYPKRQNFESLTFAQNRLEDENDFEFVQTWCLARQSTALDVYITKKAGSTVRNASGVDREVRKVRHFPLSCTRRGRISRVLFLRKIVWKPRTICNLSKHGV